MRYAAGCLCSALLASLFTFWLTQPDENRLVAQETGPILPGAPTGPRQDEPPALPPRRGFTPAPTPGEPAAPRSRPNASSPQPGAAPSLKPVPDPLSSEPPSRKATPAAGERFREDAPSETPPPAEYDLTPEEAVNVAVYEKCNRGVVNITSKGLPGERFLFMEVPADGSGSGSIIDKQGHVLTNFHVVENAQQVEVALFDGSTFDAKFVGADPVNDLAVIKIDAPPEKLFPIPIGDSSLLKVGMRVFAIGNPFGLERTMTEGIVSSLNRSLQIRGNRSIKAIIQTDAAVNPGNSGGPLLDSRGQLVGVNTAIATAHAGQSAGVALAIPATLVSRVVPQLVRHGRVIRPEIGIQQVLETENGLRIAALTPGGPAERAGLRGPQISRARRGPFVWEQI
ncbi:MAG TPA: trypsin-like peptidase domain-containing protein, partial [Planctomycetaceae bacterium]